MAGGKASADDWTRAEPGRQDVFAGVAGFTRVCAYDRPGTPVGEAPSRSDPVPQPITAGDSVADLHALVAAAGIATPFVIVGHSYGGLFATYLLLTEPSMYKRYIIVSPSLWYSERIAFQMEDAAAARGEPANANVFLSVGALENPAMPNDLRDFYNRLKSRNRPGLKLTLEVFEDERHDSVFPGAVTRGLRTVFESLGPRPDDAP